jgi:hypothetical protein
MAYEDGGHEEKDEFADACCVGMSAGMEDLVEGYALKAG